MQSRNTYTIWARTNLEIGNLRFHLLSNLTAASVDHIFRWIFDYGYCLILATFAGKPVIILLHALDLSMVAELLKYIDEEK